MSLAVSLARRPSVAGIGMRRRLRWQRPGVAGGSRGFTLFELLLALSIFALVSTMAYSGLRSVMEAGAATRVQARVLGSLQVAFGRIERDFEQAAARPIRDAYGDVQAAMTGRRAIALVEFTRAGEANPARLRRSSLRRVAYAVRDDALVRLSWPALDRGDGREPLEQVLVEGVRSVRLRFLDGVRQWRDDWPPVGTAENNVAVLPRAVEIIVTLVDFGEINRVLRVAG